jgi:hypothetical protein
VAIASSQVNKPPDVSRMRLDEHSTNSLFNLYGFPYRINCVE